MDGCYRTGYKDFEVQDLIAQYDIDFISKGRNTSQELIVHSSTDVVNPLVELCFRGYVDTYNKISHTGILRNPRIVNDGGNEYIFTDAPESFELPYAHILISKYRKNSNHAAFVRLTQSRKKPLLSLRLMKGIEQFLDNEIEKIKISA